MFVFMHIRSKHNFVIRIGCKPSEGDNLNSAYSSLRNEMPIYDFAGGLIDAYHCGGCFLLGPRDHISRSFSCISFWAVLSNFSAHCLFKLPTEFKVSYTPGIVLRVATVLV